MNKKNKEKEKQMIKKIITTIQEFFKKDKDEPRWDKVTWSGKYLDINECLEHDFARKEIQNGAIQKLVDDDFVRIIKVNGEQKIEYSNQFLWLLKNDKR